MGGRHHFFAVARSENGPKSGGGDGEPSQPPRLRFGGMASAPSEAARVAGQPQGHPRHHQQGHPVNGLRDGRFGRRR